MDLILWRHAEAENDGPDLQRALTPRGREQAQHAAAWLAPRLAADCEILVSPALRAQQTAAALARSFAICDRVGPGVAAVEVLAAAGWPERGHAVVIVGHQPTLGRVAARLLCGVEADWEIGKGALWWLRSQGAGALLRAAIAPELS